MKPNENDTLSTVASGSNMRNAALDGVRGIAIILVLIDHWAPDVIIHKLGEWIAPVLYFKRTFNHYLERQ